MKIYKADIVHTPTWGEMETIKDGYVVVEDGKVIAVQKELSEEQKDVELIDYSGKLLMPSFTDLHLHAPQYANMGLGMDLELLPWLNTYTFPEEEKYSEKAYAEHMFKHLIQDLYKYGSLRSVIFSSLDADATIMLMEMMEKTGLSAFIGKVNLDRNGTETYVEDTEQSITDTIKVLEEFKSKSGRVQPIITPRFIPTCTNEIMEKLAEIADERDLAVQTHLNENRSEVEWVKELVPESTNYLNAYDIRGTLRESKTIMAHSIYNTEDELNVLADKQIYVAHCPSSNINLMSGVAKTRKMIDHGIPVGLGSDVSGGDSLNMTDNIVDAIKASKLLGVLGGDMEDIISIEEAFFLATRGSGSFFGDTGAFEPGFNFDAIVVDDETINVRLGEPSVKERLEMFVYKGDERNIVERILEGEVLSYPEF